MTELLTTRTAGAAPTVDARVMTCDVPVIRTRVERPAVRPAPSCRPTGRRPQTRANGTAAPARTPEIAQRADRSGVRTGARTSGRAVRARSNTPTAAHVSRRRRWVAGVVTGLGLAVFVAVLGMVGDDYQHAVTQTPSATEVVHVRSGESLSSVAARIAPDQPTASVIATVRDLNDLQGAGLRPGQALVVPAYR